MPNILVTGGGGFIGSHLVDSLLDGGNSVTVLDNFSTGQMDNIRHNLERPGFHLVEGSILDEDVLDRLIGETEMVYHLAAAVGVRYIVDDPLLGMTTNAIGTEKVLRLAHKHGAKVLLASTSEIYGKRMDAPFREGEDTVLGPTKVPRWSYSVAKALGEHLAFAHHRRGLAVSVVRYCNAFGPRTDIRGYGSVVAHFIGQALAGLPLTVYGAGWQTRCFCYVEDTVRGTIMAATKPEGVGEVFNIGTDKDEISMAELARRIIRIAESPSDVVFIPYEAVYGADFEETLRRVPAMDRAREKLGFDATIELDDGLRRTIEWFSKRMSASK